MVCFGYFAMFCLYIRFPLDAAKHSAPTRQYQCTAYSAVVTMAVVLMVRFGPPGAFSKVRDLARNIGELILYSQASSQSGTEGYRGILGCERAMVPAKDRRAPCLEAKFKVRGVWGSEKAVLRETAPSFTNKTSNSHLHSFRFAPPPFTTTSQPFLHVFAAAAQHHING